MSSSAARAVALDQRTRIKTWVRWYKAEPSAPSSRADAEIESDGNQSGTPDFAPRRHAPDNVFIERLRPSLKDERISLDAFATGSQSRAAFGRWIGYPNGSRPRTAPGGRTPAQVHTIPAGIEPEA